jgi:hypothetical protein
MGAPLFIKEALVQLHAGSAVVGPCHISSFAINAVPGDTKEQATICGVQIQRAATTYTLDLSGIQDWAATDGVSAFLWDHEGEDVDYYAAAYGPADPTADTPAFTGQIRCMAGPYGGEADEYAMYELSDIPCVDKPTKVTAAAGVPVWVTGGTAFRAEDEAEDVAA